MLNTVIAILTRYSDREREREKEIDWPMLTMNLEMSLSIYFRLDSY